MIHYTLNRADTFDCRRKRFDPDVIVKIAPLATNGSHPISQVPGFSTKVTIGQNGSALFDVWQGSTPITVNAIAWTELGAEESWPLIESTYLELTKKLGAGSKPKQLACPESLPWLATYMILPGPSWLADFEQCMAIAILERFNVDHGLTLR